MASTAFVRRQHAVGNDVQCSGKNRNFLQETRETLPTECACFSLLCSQRSHSASIWCSKVSRTPSRPMQCPSITSHSPPRFSGSRLSSRSGQSPGHLDKSSREALDSTGLDGRRRPDWRAGELQARVLSAFGRCSLLGSSYQRAVPSQHGRRHNPAKPLRKNLATHSAQHFQKGGME